LERHSIYFKRRLAVAYPVEDGSATTLDEPMELRLNNGEDEEALLLLLKIMHNSSDPLPTRLQLDMLVPFAHLVQLYELQAYTSMVVHSLWFTEFWVKNSLDFSYPALIEIAGLAYCAWAFRNETLFRNATAALIWRSYSTIKPQEHIWCFPAQYNSMKPTNFE
jgi:hypothetical protein